MATVSFRRKRWVLDYCDQHGKRRWKTMPKGTTKKEAQQKLGEVIKLVHTGIHRSPKEIPLFKDVAASWLNSKEVVVRYSTLKQYRSHVQIHLNPLLGHLKINRITFAVVEQYKAHRLQEGVSVVTLNKTLTTLGAIMQYALRARYIDHNIAREVDRPKRNVEKPDINVLQPEQIRALLNATPHQKYRVLLMTAALTGLRQGELLGLKWQDIDWESQQINVRRTFNHGRFFEPKSRASKRSVDLAPALLHELKKWKLACLRGELDLVFPNDKGRPINHSNLHNRHFKPALQAAGLSTGIRFHDLRHTFASLLIEQKENIRYIMAQLGHSSVTMTINVYGHLMNDSNPEAAERLGQTVLGW
jgi:integrase